MTPEDLQRWALEWAAKQPTSSLQKCQGMNAGYAAGILAGLNIAAAHFEANSARAEAERAKTRDFTTRLVWLRIRRQHDDIAMEIRELRRCLTETTSTS